MYVHCPVQQSTIRTLRRHRFPRAVVTCRSETTESSGPGRDRSEPSYPTAGYIQTEPYWRDASDYGRRNAFMLTTLQHNGTIRLANLAHDAEAWRGECSSKIAKDTSRQCITPSPVAYWADMAACALLTNSRAAM
ncbi:hypothetical protein PBRA_002118 [Plasmodiophora brassicae]|uniref:Uncharacterized protein n=1 Tax=Plasmodiophora brassicae TaxID=37360 RepID=A0A0G4J1V9_PLABS|nr:hypothetical protein PBRA_002118 [Plasmodiophora brassicae]